METLVVWRGAIAGRSGAKFPVGASCSPTAFSFWVALEESRDSVLSSLAAHCFSGVTKEPGSCRTVDS